jgi:hypothetical protein
MLGFHASSCCWDQQGGCLSSARSKRQPVPVDRRELDRNRAVWPDGAGRRIGPAADLQHVQRLR